MTCQLLPQPPSDRIDGRADSAHRFFAAGRQFDSCARLFVGFCFCFSPSALPPARSLAHSCNIDQRTTTAHESRTPTTTTPCCTPLRCTPQTTPLHCSRVTDDRIAADLSQASRAATAELHSLNRRVRQEPFVATVSCLRLLPTGAISLIRVRFDSIRFVPLRLEPVLLRACAIHPTTTHSSRVGRGGRISRLGWS